MTTDKTKRFFRVSAEDFKKIPGSPIAYWASKTITNSFDNKNTASLFADFRHGMSTSDNKRFLRFWFEVAINNIGLGTTTKKDTVVQKCIESKVGDIDYIFNKYLGTDRLGY